MSAPSQSRPSSHGTPAYSTPPNGSSRHAEFNAFSYGDVAAELSITTAALHYHYPRKHYPRKH